MGKCCCLVTVVVVAVLVVALAVGIPVGMKKAKETVGLSGNNNVASAACGVTSYPDTCNQTLSGSSNGASTTSTGVTKLSVQSASTGVNNTKDSVMAMNYGANLTAAVEVCLESLGLSTDQLDQALQELSSSMNASARQKSMSDIQAWLTAAMEFHTTCIDAFMEISPADGRALQNQTSHTVELFSNALAFANALAAYGEDVMDWKPTGFSLPSNFSLSDLANTPLPKLPSFGNRRLLSSPELDLEESDEGFKLPSWVVDEHVQRHLLATPTSFNAIVAKDGSGDFESIQDAVDASLKDGMNDSSRYVIYIKAGEYKEQVKIPKSAVNLMLIGDGIDQTIITGNKSVALTPNMTTFKSATLIVGGRGFIGKYFTVRNTAGSSGHQAVAVRVSADQVAFDSCSFDSFQDTLYAHTLRQFYTNCTVYGTVDFIFGNAAAVFQSCNIIAKQTTLVGQQVTYTAQGRIDPHQKSGLSFQNCTFDAVPEVKSNTTYYKTYLGRPWKAYSVCVTLKCDLMEHIDPSGWLPWNTSDFGLATSFFAEYQNVGPGSNTSTRVPWSHQITDADVAASYQATEFIEATDWLSNNNGIALTLTL